MKKEEKEKLFEEFWELYAKKVGKHKAKQKFMRLTGTDVLTILERVSFYVMATPDLQYRMHPTTYINGRHWEDEIYIRPQKDQKVKDKLDKYG